MKNIILLKINKKLSDSDNFFDIVISTAPFNIILTDNKN